MMSSRNRSSRFLTDSRPQNDSHQLCYSLTSFYREEFIKCQRCLDAQREFYSERAISEVERALTKVMAELDRICTKSDANQVVGHLLRQFDVIAGLSAWSDPKHVH
jgi:hypothetical protein